MNSRRSFICCSGLAAAAAGFGLAPAVSFGAVRRARWRIVIDDSFRFPAWSRALGHATGAESSAAASTRRQRGASQRPDELTLFALTAPGVEPFATDQARALSREANDRLAAMVSAARDRTRVGALATLSSTDPFAVREADRAINQLGLTGLSLAANRAMPLDDRSLWPVYEFAAASRVPVYLPTSAAATAAVASADSGRHLTQLIMGGVLDAFPALTVVLARLGEGAPHWYGRAADATAVLRDTGRASPRRPLEDYLSNNILLTTADMTAQTLQFCSGGAMCTASAAPAIVSIALAAYPIYRRSI